MTHWHITVEHRQDVDEQTAEQLGEDIVESGATTATIDRDRGVVGISVIVEAGTPRQAGEAGQRKAREAAAAAGVTGPVVRVEQITDEQLDVELRQPALPELVGMTEAGQILDVSRQRVAQLAAEHDDFPTPVAELASGRIYTADSIRAFDQRWERKRTGRPRKG